MFSDFLANCTAVLTDEEESFYSIRNNLNARKPFICYMPSITLDLWPIFALHCTSVRDFVSPHTAPTIFLMPIGAHHFWAKPEFCDFVLNFYHNDSYPDHRNIYNFELEEMILLQYPKAADSLVLAELGICNAIYVRLSNGGVKDVHLFILLEDPSEGWKTIVERYEIPVQLLIDSHKGMGNWFEDIPLFQYMTGTSKPNLLPNYYFKGKYISHPAPTGFQLLTAIAESSVTEHSSELFRTSW